MRGLPRRPRPSGNGFTIGPPPGPRGGNRRTAAARSRNAPRSTPRNDCPAEASRSPDSPPCAPAGSPRRPRRDYHQPRRLPLRPPAGADGLGRDLDPPGEVTSLAAGRLIPWHPDRPAEPEPPQQVHPIRPLRRRGPPPAACQVPQVNRDRPDHLTRRIDQPIRIPRTTRRLKETSRRNDKACHIPMKII